MLFSLLYFNAPSTAGGVDGEGGNWMGSFDEDMFVLVFLLSFMLLLPQVAMTGELAIGWVALMRTWRTLPLFIPSTPQARERISSGCSSSSRSSSLAVSPWPRCRSTSCVSIGPFCPLLLKHRCVCVCVTQLLLLLVSNSAACVMLCLLYCLSLTVCVHNTVAPPTLLSLWHLYTCPCVGTAADVALYTPPSPQIFACM